MKVFKLDFATGDKIRVHKSNIVLFERNPNKYIHCINCNKKVMFGNTRTSLQYTVENIGLPVCSKCYEIELQLKNN